MNNLSLLPALATLIETKLAKALSSGCDTVNWVLPMKGGSWVQNRHMYNYVRNFNLTIIKAERQATKLPNYLAIRYIKVSAPLQMPLQHGMY